MADIHNFLQSCTVYTEPDRWLQLPGNYGVTCRVQCRWCGTRNSLVLEGESHDEEPSIGAGHWHCERCSAEGSWEGEQGRYIGHTGMSTPGMVTLSCSEMRGLSEADFVDQ